LESQILFGRIEIHKIWASPMLISFGVEFFKAIDILAQLLEMFLELALCLARQKLAAVSIGGKATTS
jgi:hypothetical protein